MDFVARIVSEAVLFRGIERLLIVCAAMFFAYLGYRLFKNGIESARSKLETKGHGFSLILSGTAPGLFFMAFGAIILVFCVSTRLEVKPISVTVVQGPQIGTNNWNASGLQLVPKFSIGTNGLIEPQSVGPYEIECSTDVFNWPPLTNVSLICVPSMIVETTTNGFQYYRAVTLP